jgi:hypothetical protein
MTLDNKAPKENAEKGNSGLESNQSKVKPRTTKVISSQTSQSSTQPDSGSSKSGKQGG